MIFENAVQPRHHFAQRADSRVHEMPGRQLPGLVWKNCLHSVRPWQVLRHQRVQHMHAVPCRNVQHCLRAEQELRRMSQRHVCDSSWRHCMRLLSSGHHIICSKWRNHCLHRLQPWVLCPRSSICNMCIVQRRILAGQFTLHLVRELCVRDVFTLCRVQYVC